MTAATAIEARDLTKVYGKVRAVDRVTFTVEPGRVTGFLGPDGAGAAHGSRTGRAHLAALAAGDRIPDRRVDEVLESTGIAKAAHRRVRTYSPGMRQRLGIALLVLGKGRVLAGRGYTATRDDDGRRHVVECAAVSQEA